MQWIGEKAPEQLRSRFEKTDTASEQQAPDNNAPAKKQKNDFDPVVVMENRCKTFPDEEFFKVAEAYARQVTPDVEMTTGKGAVSFEVPEGWDDRDFGQALGDKIKAWPDGWTQQGDLTVCPQVRCYAEAMLKGPKEKEICAPELEAQ